jgi:hypothetical protein
VITYATYDLTNLATVKNWPLIVTVVDLAWGGVLATSVGYLGFLAGKWLVKAASPDRRRRHWCDFYPHQLFPEHPA